MLTRLLKPALPAALLAASLWLAGANPLAAATLKPGERFPDLKAANLEGDLPADLTNKVILVDFWASWCGPCKKSFPIMDQLQKKYGPRAFVIIAISVDEKKEALAGFLKQNPVSLVVVRDPGHKLVARVDVSTMPSSFLLDRSGTIRHVHAGFHGAQTRKQYEREIEALLKD
jgi:thiol-disulfide isomerase/thioredoxin